MDIIERGIMQQLRFQLNGNLSIEDVYQLPLIAKREGGSDLQALSKKYYNKMKEDEVPDFINGTTPDTTSSLAFKIIMRVIELKKKEQLAAIQAKELSQKKQELLKVMDEKKFHDKTYEELRKMFNEL